MLTAFTAWLTPSLASTKYCLDTNILHIWLPNPGICWQQVKSEHISLVMFSVSNSHCAASHLPAACCNCYDSLLSFSSQLKRVFNSEQLQKFVSHSTSFRSAPKTRELQACVVIQETLNLSHEIVLHCKQGLLALVSKRATAIERSRFARQPMMLRIIHTLMKPQCPGSPTAKCSSKDLMPFQTRTRRGKLSN